MDLSDSELIDMLVAGLIVVVLLCLPASIRAWRLWHTKDPAANDSIFRP